MKILSGSEIAGFIKERQAKQVRSLRQAHGVFPKLAIIKTIDDPVIETYVRLKRQYGEDILVDVEVFDVMSSHLIETIDRLNEDTTVHGIIVQLPLGDPSQLDDALNRVKAKKDVDGLSRDSIFDPATPMAINWLLDGFNIELRGKKVVIVGKGRLVGAPLERIYAQMGYNVTALDESVTDLKSELINAEVVISATGVAGLIGSDMLQHGAVAVDAGVAVEKGQTLGDFAPDVYARDDLALTPKKGGVGPLTVCALFENVLRAASLSVQD